MGGEMKTARPVAELIADDMGKYLDCNDLATELVGYSREELVGMSVWDLTPGADEIQGLLLWQEFIRVGFSAGLYRLVRKDSAEVEVLFKAIANVSPGRHLSRLEPAAGTIRRAAPPTRTEAADGAIAAS